jgi:tetratricopeptide (TPR) repeat protein
MARRVADEQTRLEVLVAATSALSYFGDPRERLVLDTELVTLATRLGDRVSALRGLMRLAFEHLEIGDTESADRTIEDYDRLSRAVNLPAFRWRAPMLRAMRAVMQGRFDESEALCAEAAATAARVDDAIAPLTLAIHTAGRLWAARRLDELDAHLPRALELLAPIADGVYRRAFRVGMLARLGRAEEARDDLEFLVRHDPPLRGLPVLVFAADACLALGDRDAAATLAQLLAPIANRHHDWGGLLMVMEGPIADWVERLHELAGQRPVTHVAEPSVSAPTTARFELIKEGELWTIRADTTFRLRDTRGLSILEKLVTHPGREFHVTDLVAPAGERGLLEDAGDALDAQAIAAYKHRLEDLREAETEATEHNDLARAAAARAEIDALANELARGVGLGGHARKASSTTEKARVNVRQRLLDAMTRIAEHSPALGKHLRQAIRTGTFCSYDP